jgi:hypothetical protein
MLTYQTHEARVLVVDAQGQPILDDNGERQYTQGETSTHSLGVHLERSSVAGPAERPGAEGDRATHKGQVVLTEDGDTPTPLDLPAGVRRFGLSYNGISGQFVILPIPDSQHPKVRAKLGMEFYGIFTA